VPTARFDVIPSIRAPWPAGWKPPVVLKPVRQGSSVGLQFVERTEDWVAALAESMRYDTQVLVEEMIRGRECTVAILDDQPLPILEIRPKQGGYDYTNKYTPGRTDYLCPAPFDPATSNHIRETALAAFHAVGGRDYARVDIIVPPEGGNPVVLEVNTLPGMTESSLFPKAAEAAGISFTDLCERMIDLAIRRAQPATL